MRPIKFIFVLLLLPAILAACAPNLGVNVTADVCLGEYGRARSTIGQHLTKDSSDRQYLLDRMRLMITTMDDGYPAAAQPTFEEVYNVLRTQGINADKTVASVVINERVKFWKGEPFEQALALFYYSVQQASLGSWDNARAAAGASLFHLKDFGHNAQGQSVDALDVLRRSDEYERAHAPGGTTLGGTTYLNSGYAVRDSNFALGHVMNGLANAQLGRDQEAHDNYAVAVQINPDLRALVDELTAGQYNTVLVVSYGLGPQKIAYGPDEALTAFGPRYSSDRHPLLCWVDTAAAAARQSHALPVVCDVNTMAVDLMWNNLEDVRHAKSIIGSLLLEGGAVAAVAGAEAHSREAAIAGLAAMAGGALLKAGAHADLRYCDIMPQRIYLVPVNVGPDTTVVNLQIQGNSGSRLSLTGLSPPPPGTKVQLRYVRLVSGLPGVEPFAPGWALSGRVLYANEVTGSTDRGRPIAGSDLPYILGGHSALPPSAAALQDYQRQGQLTNLTPAELENLYRQERIQFRLDLLGGARLDRHVFEGGRGLIAPQGGTAGFARLFGQEHPPYTPRSMDLRRIAEQIRPPPTAVAPSP